MDPYLIKYELLMGNIALVHVPVLDKAMSKEVKKRLENYYEKLYRQMKKLHISHTRHIEIKYASSGIIISIIAGLMQSFYNFFESGKWSKVQGIRTDLGGHSEVTVNLYPGYDILDWGEFTGSIFLMDRILNDCDVFFEILRYVWGGDVSKVITLKNTSLGIIETVIL